jgi:tetratricopeptide (TPR) repeat protein
MKASFFIAMHVCICAAVPVRRGELYFTGEGIMQIKLERLFVLCLVVACTGACSDTAGNQARKYVDEGISLFKSGDCKGANTSFEKALKKDPNIAAGYFYMAQCSVKNNNFQEGLAQIKKAYSLSQDEKEKKDFIRFLITSGQDAGKKGDHDHAIMFLNECAALDKRDSTVHLLLGKALLERDKEGDLKAAIAEFKAAQGASEDKKQNIAQVREIIFNKANDYLQKNDMYKATRCYLAYTENFNQKDADAYVKLGRLMLEMGNTIGAKYYAKKAWNLEPNNKGVIALNGDLNGPIHQ